MLIGAYVVNYFTVKKLGMVRYVNFYINKWENTYPVNTMKYSTVAVFLLLTVLILLIYLKKKENLSKYTMFICGITVLATFIFVGYICICSKETMRAYYFIAILLGAANLIQIIKAGIAICLKKEI